MLDGLRKFKIKLIQMDLIFESILNSNYPMDNHMLEDGVDHKLMDQDLGPLL